MKFGPVPVAHAKGAILAHSEHVSGVRLRKGHVLTAQNIAALQADGMEMVTVARLEAGDMHEDDAAQAVAAAICDDAEHMHLSVPFTGRVNLIADAPGVVLIEAAKIDAANAVDPMITVATVAPFYQIHAGGMIATVKIIAYGVPESVVVEAADRAYGAITLAVPVFKSASLIVTEVPGGHAGKGEEAIATRLNGLGMTLIETLRCTHEEHALATLIGQAKGDLVLILTGSATSDPHDTAPEALRLAGGRMERFGMPVDPGNLLFLGEVRDKPVIGLPGSARSPVLHGADWVLSRVACGLTVTSADIAEMGVGGLLKEIPTRPQPRQRKSHN